MYPLSYLASLSDKIFKILPLREKELNGEPVYLSRYIDGLVKEMRGSCYGSHALSENKYYATIISTLYFLRENSVDHDECKQQVFGMLDNLGKVKKDIGDADV